MPPPFDTVISIGGQSLVDGVWRLLGPALEGLTNPLPLALPGFSNATMRITRIIPIFPGTPPPTGALNVIATIELTAEALLNVTAAGGGFNISLGPQELSLTSLTGTIGLPAQTGTLTDLNIAGTVPAPIGRVNLGPGAGALNLPASTARLTEGDLTGTLNLPGSLTLPGIPLPAVVPVAVDLTPSAPLAAGASLRLTVTGINPTTRFGLLFSVDEVEVADITLDPSLPANLTTTLQAAVNQIVRQLGIPDVITQRPIDMDTVSGLLRPVAGLVRTALDDALTRLLAETGRLIFPPAGAGASCDVNVLPTAGDAQLIVAAADNTYVLQVGFSRVSSTDIMAFPAFAPAGIADTTLLVGNAFLLELLCCLVQRLPAFTLPVAATTGTTDVTGATHLMCCNFTGATLDLGPVALGGGLSVCIDGASGAPKTFTLIGRFAQNTAVADIAVDFSLPLTFDLDDVASLAHLRVLGSPTVTVKVSPNGLLIATLAAGGLLLVGPAVGVVAIALVVAACWAAESLLNNSARTVLREASLVRSPVSVPPGVFEAFGKLVPVTVSIDDLTADSVLQTPTAPWALLPRIGIGRQRRERAVNRSFSSGF